MRQTPHCQKHPVTSLPNPPSHGDDDVPSGDVDKANDDSDDDRNGDFLRIFGASPCLLFPVKVAVTGRIQSHTITPLCHLLLHCIAPPAFYFNFHLNNTLKSTVNMQGGSYRENSVAYHYATLPWHEAPYCIAPPLSISTQCKPQCHNVTIATQQ